MDPSVSPSPLVGETKRCIFWYHCRIEEYFSSNDSSKEVHVLTFGTAAWNKKEVKGDMVLLVARKLIFMACVPGSFSNEKSTFNPPFSTAVTVGNDGPGKKKNKQTEDPE